MFSLTNHPLHQARLIPAMVTPFTDKNEVDITALQALAEYLVKEQACDALLVNGTTGESPTTTLAEKQAMVDAVKQTVGLEVMVMTGAGGNNTAQTITDSQALVTAGADALLIVVPYYNKPSQRGMVAHFTAVAEANPTTPIVIYNIPGRTGSTMVPETMAQLHQACPNIVGVKQSLNCMETATKIRTLLPESFTLWSGDDPITLPMMTCGATGVVSVLAHVAGQSIQAMMQAYKAGNVARAQALHQQLLPLAQGIFALPNPTIIKALVACYAPDIVPIATYRLPMVAATEEEQARLIAPLQAQLAAVDSEMAASCS